MGSERPAAAAWLKRVVQATRSYQSAVTRTPKEVERYTKAANWVRLANSAMAALQTAQKKGPNWESAIQNWLTWPELLAKVQFKLLFYKEKK
jgi:hypothetical protein